jgi:EthD domain
MIHQLIFASPKPDMTEAEFLRYWIEVHAVKYASKIPQIKRYLIDSRVAKPGETGEPLFSGIAEIWIDAQDQLPSLQTKEFLEGARLDEPKWAAFWKTLVLDTQAHELLAGPPLRKGQDWVKVVTLLKRKEGLPLADFRRRALEQHAPRALELPGLRRYLQCYVVDGFYAVGESRFDAVSLQWFDTPQAAEAAQASAEGVAVAAHLETIAEPRYLFSMTARESWIIGPAAR